MCEYRLAHAHHEDRVNFGINSNNKYINYHYDYYICRVGWYRKTHKRTHAHIIQIAVLCECELLLAICLCPLFHCVHKKHIHTQYTYTSTSSCWQFSPPRWRLWWQTFAPRVSHFLVVVVFIAGVAFLFAVRCLMLRPRFHVSFIFIYALTVSARTVTSFHTCHANAKQCSN